MMKIIINKKKQEVAGGTTIENILEREEKRMVAVWVNHKQLLEEDYMTYEIKEGDNISILRILTGG